ncbi:MAG: NADH-quinone oxidoreductase subunit N [Opitutaceae bacterium]
MPPAFVLASHNPWLAVWPELALGCLALGLLVYEIVLPAAAHRFIPAVGIVGQIAILAGVLANLHSSWLGRESFNGLLRHSMAGQGMRVFFLVSSILVFVLARIALKRQAMPRVEFYHIVLVVTAAMMLLVQSNHFVMLFVSLETVTVGFYILVSYCRDNALTLEAGLKYLINSALSASVLLFGIALLYGVAGSRALPAHTAHAMRYDALARFLAANPHNFVAAAGIVLVLAGIGFKIGAFPFQFWIPDVYQGAPTPVTAFLAVGSKAAGFAVLLGLVQRAFPGYQWLTVPVLAFLAAATIIFGNLAALTQHNVKRLIGLSGVSHAGFLLLGVVAADLGSRLAPAAVYFYLWAYLLASFAVFAVMVHMAGANDAEQELEHYAGLAKEDPFLGGVLTIGLASLAGIPPLAGFMGKFFVFVAAFEAHLYWLLAIAIAGVTVSIYYYFGWVRAAYFDTWRPSTELAPRPERTSVDLWSRLAALGLALASVVLGFYQGGLGHWIRW